MSQDEGGPAPVDDGEIHEWLDGELSAARVAELEALTHASPEFARRVAEARGLIAASSRILGALDEVPAGVLPRLSVAPTVVAKESDSGAVRVAHRWSVRRMSSIAALLMVGVTGVVIARREPTLREPDALVSAGSATAAPALSPAVPAATARIEVASDAAVSGQMAATGVVSGEVVPGEVASAESASRGVQTARQSEQAPLASAAPLSAGAPAPSQSMGSAGEAPLSPKAIAAAPPPEPLRPTDVAAAAKASELRSAEVAERRSAIAPMRGAARFSGGSVLGAPSAISADAADNAEILSDVFAADLLFGVQRVECVSGCVQVRIEVARDGRLRRWIQSLGQATVTDTSTLHATTLAELTLRMAALRLDTLPAVLQLDGSKCSSVGSLRESLRVSFAHNNAPRQVMGLPWCTDGNHVLDRAAQVIEEAAALKLGRVSRRIR